ncbi:MAG: bifunctional nuclease family protein [Armatimonadetes bacterium]|nr:bifunctional nuclease family protein [Armatimonadota bacterium]
MPEDFEPHNEGDEELDTPPAFFPYSGDEEEQPVSRGPLVQVQVKGVYQTETDRDIQRYVFLSDGSRRELPIMIGAFEAHAIDMPLEGRVPDRPITHDLIKTMLERLSATVDRVVIDDVWNGVYYAKLHILAGGEDIEIDTRPSDAIALAVRFDAPIYVAEGILDEDTQV